MVDKNGHCESCPNRYDSPERPKAVEDLDPEWWFLEVFDSRTNVEKWETFLRSHDLEEVMSELMRFRRGVFNDFFTRARLVTPERKN